MSVTLQTSVHEHTPARTMRLCVLVTLQQPFRLARRSLLGFGDLHWKRSRRHGTHLRRRLVCWLRRWLLRLRWWTEELLGWALRRRRSELGRPSLCECVCVCLSSSERVGAEQC